MNTTQSQTQVYQFRVWLREISPAIWRRILVRNDSTIADLHETLQIVMGWTDFHLHQFFIRGKEYGIPRQYGPWFKDNPKTIRLADFQFLPRERFVYEYDFTDFWQLEVRLEKILPLDSKKIYPLCIGGGRATPEEDCGGARAYLELSNHHRLNPPLEELSLMADIISRVLNAKAGETVRDVIGNADELQEAIFRLEDYNRLRPEHFDRREVNRQLRLYATDKQKRQAKTEEC